MAAKIVSTEEVSRSHQGKVRRCRRPLILPKPHLRPLCCTPPCTQPPTPHPLIYSSSQRTLSASSVFSHSPAMSLTLRPSTNSVAFRLPDNIR